MCVWLLKRGPVERPQDLGKAAALPPCLPPAPAQAGDAVGWWDLGPPPACPQARTGTDTVSPCHPIHKMELLGGLVSPPRLSLEETESQPGGDVAKVWRSGVSVVLTESTVGIHLGLIQQLPCCCRARLSSAASSIPPASPLPGSLPASPAGIQLLLYYCCIQRGLLHLFCTYRPAHILDLNFYLFFACCSTKQ